MTELSKVRPDRDALVAQLITALSQKDAWRDRVVSSTGKTLVDFVAAVGAYSQYSIESAYQEVWPESAKNRSSLYAASNFLGVRYNRKAPALMTANVSATAAQTLAPYTQFVVAGTFWFNRTPVALTTSAQQVTLYQGKIVSTSVSGLGTDFQAYVSPETSFTVSDTDVLITINGNAIPSTLRGLWSFVDKPAVQQFTLPSGQAIFLFGNANYGSKPGVNDTVTITYAVTLGADGNNLPVYGQKIALSSGDKTFSGIVATAPQGGANETDAFAWKNITPALSGSFDSAVTPSQYKATPMLYPGVIDAQTFSQREINPKALTWMNNIRVVILPNTPWGDTEWNSFVDFMTDRTMYKCQFVRRDPVPTDVTVELDVYCSNFANLNDIKSRVIASIQDLFSPRQGILGFDFYRFDIEVKAKSSDNNIEYIVLKQPTSDIILSSLNVGAPTVVNNTGGGSITPGPYDYAISAVSTLGGETAPAKWTTINVAAGSSTNVISWDPVANAVSYKVWGRQTGVALGLLGTVLASAPLTFTDNGSINPTGTVPVEATIDSYYARLASVTVNMFYSTRSKKLGLEG